ncbi:hypothetical protein CANINC_000326 [Pichia inconspicua]|uniref:Uncharacterized protein n=1 Tax=Pichia inconspicua TaxID=52247 RepID=A0A4T0X7Y6_9ASCO|nr:hypothetical protein CANINC_000326 [[Candida] inconspicua]
MEITDQVALQKARISRAYLDQAKSFGIEQDLEFCPCLEPSAVNLYNQSLVNGYAAPINSMRQQNSNVQQQTIDSESICKILAAAAANIGTNSYDSSRTGNTAKISNMNVLKNNVMKNQNPSNTKTRYFS